MKKKGSPSFLGIQGERVEFPLSNFTLFYIWLSIEDKREKGFCMELNNYGNLLKSEVSNFISDKERISFSKEYKNSSKVRKIVYKGIREDEHYFGDFYTREKIGEFYIARERSDIERLSESLIKVRRNALDKIISEMVDGEIYPSRVTKLPN